MLKITLHSVIQLLQEESLLKLIIRQGHYYYDLPNDYQFNHVSFNSKETHPNTLFFCKGAKFKAEYLLEALNKGCLFYISEKPYGEHHQHRDAINLLVTDVYKAMANIAQEFYGNPQKALKTIAFTGTKGKTTSAYFTKKLLDEDYPANKVAMFTTMQNTTDGIHYSKSLNSTYEALDLYRMMWEAVNNGCQYLVMEASSHGYKMNRLYNLTFDVGVFLNISPDHIGPVEHPDFEDYLYHKLLLIQHSKQMVFNKDMELSNLLTSVCDFYQVSYTTFSSFNQDADYVLNKGSQNTFSIEDRVHNHTEEDLSISLLGEFNQMNALAAIAAIHTLEPMTPLTHKKALADVLVPGRMESIKVDEGKTIYIDYAHNYLSLLNLIQLVKEKHPQARLSLVIGSTGNKAESRRKDFGQLIDQYINHAYVTSDDPDFENPKEIADEIISYVSDPDKTSIIIDRQVAIETAIENMQNQEVLLLAGKGADTFQKIQGKHKTYLGDGIIARNYLQQDH